MLSTAQWCSGNQLVWIGIEALSLVVIPLDISWFVHAIGLANWSPPPPLPPPGLGRSSADERKLVGSPRTELYSGHCLRLAGRREFPLRAKRELGGCDLAPSGNCASGHCLRLAGATVG